MLRKIFIISTILFVFLFLQCKEVHSTKKVNTRDTSALFSPNGHWIVYIQNLKLKEEVPLYCEVAITQKQQSTGLMFREQLAQNQCMVFAYKKPQLVSFWMKSTTLPLTIAYVSVNNTIIETFNMVPYDESVINSTIATKYAIEVNRNWFRKNSSFAGTKIRIEKFPNTPIPIEKLFFKDK